MRIAIDARPASWYRGTGIGNYTAYLLRALSALRMPGQTYQALWTTAEDPGLPGELGLDWLPVPKDKREEAVTIPRWLSASGAEVFHVPQNGFRVPPELPPDTRLVVTIHDLIPFVLPETVRRGFLVRFIREVPEVVARADAVVAVSMWTKRDLQRILGVPDSKIEVIPSGPARPRFDVDRNLARSYIRATYGIVDPYVLYAGGLNPRKNVTELIYAYGKVCRSLPGGEVLVVVGSEGRMVDRLKALVSCLGLDDYVFFPGLVPDEDMPLFYACATAFVYPSLYEGFGLPPLEAMACGTPTITSDASSLPEVVGDAALRVSPHDTAGLARAIRDVCTDAELRQRLARAGRARAELYRWEDSARRMAALYGCLTATV